MHTVHLNGVWWPDIFFTCGGREAGQFVRQFPRLEHLIIVGCRDWPEGMGDDLPWTQLKTLELKGDDAFSSPFPLGIRGMTQFTQFQVPSGRFDLPEWIGELVQLTTLQVAAENDPALPQSVTRLQRLTSLDLSYSSLSQLPDDIGGMTALADLSLASCQELIALPPSIAELTRLTHLDISAIIWVGRAFFWVSSQLRWLRKFYMSVSVPSPRLSLLNIVLSIVL